MLMDERRVRVDYQMTSNPIICFNVNPAVELTCTIDELEIGGVNRTSGFRPSASGKASNVARTIKNLGHESFMIGPLAGKNGLTFTKLLEDEGLFGDWVWAPGETRTNVTIVESSSNRDTVINGGGPTLKSADWKHIENKLVQKSTGGAPVCISGSIPLGVNLADLTELVRTLSTEGSPVFVDASGPALEAQLSGKPYCAKFNQHEAEDLLGRTLTTLDEVVDAAIELVGRVAGLLLITMGANGVVIVDQTRKPVHILPPKVDAISAVGSGDTFLGAFVVALYRLGKPAVEATAYAAVAGAINATQLSQGEVTHDQILKLLPKVSINEITREEVGV